MKWLKDKAGKLNESMLNTAIIGVVLLVVLFKLYAVLLPELSDTRKLVSSTV